MACLGNSCCGPGSETSRDQPTTGDDARLAQEMNSLSVKERESIYDEIHGCAGIVEETPALLARCLKEMRNAIEQIPQHNRKAYNRAVFLRPSLETDDTFHRMFLRAQRFDPTKAAHHMCRSFEHKLKLFGEEKLVKRITLNDLSETEITHIYSAAIQLLPSKDSSGRGVMLVTSHNLKLDEDWYSLARYTWYQIYSAAEGSEELQKRGLVQVLSTFGDWTTKIQRMLEYVIFSGEFAGDWPIRLCSHHYCYDQMAFHRMCVTMLALRGKDFRLRNRTHFGSKMEVQYDLMTFGINLWDCLDPGSGVLSRHHMDAYLQERRVKEAEYQERENALLALRPGTTLYPTAKDVLMGRGRPFITWPGNVSLPQRVIPYIDRYIDMGDIYNGKAGIALEVVDSVRQEGGRFLQRSTGIWETVDDQKSKEKVSQIFRAEIRNRQGGEDLQESAPTTVYSAVEHVFRDFDNYLRHDTTSAKRQRLSLISNT